MRARRIALVLALVACGGAPSRDVKTAQDATGALVSEDAWTTELGASAALDKPLVRVVGASGEDVEVLSREDADTFWTTDGVTETAHAKKPAGEDAPAPDRYEPASADAIGGADARSLPALDEARLVASTLFFARVMHARHDPANERRLLASVARTQEALGARAREAIAAVLYGRALDGYAAGSAREVFEKELGGAMAFAGTKGADAASDVATKLHAPAPAFDATDPVSQVASARVAALLEYRCTGWEGFGDDQWPSGDAVGRLRQLGYNALGALLVAKRDVRPTRCIAPPIATGLPSLATVGELAARAIEKVARGRAVDESDVECGKEGDATEIATLAEEALAKHDVARAIAIAKASHGRVRGKLVERIANAGGAAAAPFLSLEAKSGPVLTARLEAARALGPRGDVSWASALAPEIDRAIASYASPVATRRCDQFTVTGGLRTLVTFAPSVAIALVTKGWASYDGHGRVLVATELASAVLKQPGDAKARDAVLKLALADARPVDGLSYVPRDAAPCRNASPSDVAASMLSKRLLLPYSCAASTADKAAAASAMTAKLGAP